MCIERTKFTKIARVAFLAAAGIVSLGIAPGQLILPGDSQAPPSFVVTSAKNFASQMPELNGALITSYTPIYAPRSSRIVFFEAKLLGVFGGGPRGFMILSAANGKVVQFASEGLTKSEQLKQKTTLPFKMVRLGPNYFAAEASRGFVVAKLGTLPQLRRKLFSPDLFEAEPALKLPWETTAAPASPNLTEIRSYPSDEAAYDDYALNYDKYFIDIVLNPPTYKPLQEMADPNDTPDDGQGSGSGGDGPDQAEAIGYDKWIRFIQIRPGSTYSDASWATGCGPTAFLNMLSWHDGNWSPKLLPGNENVFGVPFDWDPFRKANWTKTMRYEMGTFQSPPFCGSQGATFPWDISDGIDWVKNHLDAQSDFAYSYGLPFNSDSAILAQTMIKRFGKPVIVGYWSDIHYDLAYKWFTEGNGGLGYFKIRHDNGDPEWVSGSDMFFAGGAFDFGRGFLGSNQSFEAGSKGWFKVGNGRAVLRSEQSRHGTAHYRMSSSSGGKHGINRLILVPTGYKYTLAAWFRTTSNAPVKMRIKTLSGAVLKEETFPATEPYWTKYELTDIVNGGNGWLQIELEYTAPANQFSEVLIDALSLTRIIGATNTGTVPCVYKPGQPMDEGCDLP